MGDRLTINGEEVIFKGWVDQSQTAIEVKAIADPSSVKKIRAKEIKSLSRSQDLDNAERSAPKASEPSDDHREAQSRTAENLDPSPPESVAKASGEAIPNDLRDSPQPSAASDRPEVPEEVIEKPKEPEYNAWEVWTYLERQRVKTLKLLNTFQAEWEANRFVREAERSAPPNLRVHYEVRPIWLDEEEIKRSYQTTASSHTSPDDRDESHHEEYEDAIDVEVVTESL